MYAESHRMGAIPRFACKGGDVLVSRMLRKTTRATPLAVALDVIGSQINYASLFEEAEDVAAGLARLGLAPGDRMAVMLPNCRELFLVLLAAFRLGVIVVPVPLGFVPAQLETVLARTGARALFCTSACQRTVPDAPRARPEFLIVSGEAGPGQLGYVDLLGSRRSLPPLSNRDQIALIVFTSGTTGAPKGVCHTQASLVERAKAFIATMDLGPRDASLTVFPAARPVGLVSQVLAMLGCGGRIVLRERPDPEAYWQAYAECQPTYSLLMPAYARRLFAHDMAAAVDHSRLRFWLTGGDQAEAELFRLAKEKTSRPLLNMFGLTETGILAIHPLHGPGKPGSMGRPMKGVQLRIAGPDGRALEAGHTGRLHARGKHMMLGYFNDTLATHAAYVRGWFDTQDLAMQDAEGDYWFMGRARELIVRSAHNVDSRLAEQALAAHPSIQEAKLVGIDDPDEGQVPVAFYTRKPGGPIPDATDLADWMRERVDPVSMPVAFHALEAWPLTGQGKRDHAALVSLATAKARAEQDATVAAPPPGAQADERKAGS